MWTNRPRNQPLGWWLKIKSCISTAFAQIYQKFSTTHKPFSHTWAQCIFMLCGIFEDGVCEMYVEIILIRLTQFLLPPSPHAPLNRLSLPSDGALYLQFKYIDVQRQVLRHSVFSYQHVKFSSWGFCFNSFPPAPGLSTASHQSIGRQRRHWGWRWSPCRQSWGCPWCRSPRSPLCASRWEGQIWNSLLECRWSSPERWDMLLLIALKPVHTLPHVHWGPADEGCKDL